MDSSLKAPAVFRQDIAGLRAIAVLMVVFYHFGIPPFKGGFIGVDVFFVISGYLMTKIIINGLNTFDFSLRGFYMARVRRIVPALLLLCAVYLGLGALFLVPFDLKEIALQVLSSVTFLSNWNFLREFGYFETGEHAAWLQHTWSLSVEWQFYLLYPIFLLLIKRFYPTVCWWKALLGMCVLSFALSVLITPRKDSFAFYMLPTRAWEMLSGGIVCLLPQSVSRFKRAALIQLILGLSLLIGAAIWIKPGTMWPGYLALIPVLGTVLVLTTNASKHFLFNNKIVLFLGAVSYSLYLWHWPIFVGLNQLDLDESPVWTLAGVALSLGLATVSYRYAEDLIRKHLANRRQWLVLGSVYLALLGTAAGLYQWDGLPDRGVMNRYASVASAIRGPSIHDGMCAESFDTIDIPFDEKYSNCVSGDVAGKKTVVLWGDSHGQHYTPLINELAKAAHLKLHVLATAGCSPNFLKSPDYILGVNPDLCLHFKDEVLSGFDHYDAIIIAGRWDSGTEASRIKSINELNDNIQRLAHLGKPIYILAQVPAFDRDVARRYIYRKIFGLPMRTHYVERASTVALNQYLKTDLAKYPNVFFVDPASILCESSSHMCQVVAGEDSLYRDPDHLTFAGSRDIGRMLLQQNNNFLESVPGAEQKASVTHLP